MNDQAEIIDRVSSKVCKFCRMSNICWNKNFNTTYDSLCKLTTSGTVPDYFANKCLKLSALCREFGTPLVPNNAPPGDAPTNKNFISSNKKVIGLYEFEPDLEGRLSRELVMKKIRPSSVVAIKNAHGHIEIDLNLRELIPTEQLIRICEKVTSRKLRILEINSTESGRNRVRIIERPKFVAEVGSASCSATSSEQSCGDNYSFTKTENGKAIITLSDGMGSGITASRYSEATVELMQRFLHAQLPKSAAINLMNSVLMLGKDDDTFATIDVAIIDLFTGRAEFIKLGAASAYIIRRKHGEVEKISSTSLPAGVLDVVDIETLSTRVELGDYILMLSDGVENPQEPWLSDFISSSLQFHDAQTTANEILKEALDKNREPHDDMLVVACEIS